MKKLELLEKMSPILNLAERTVVWNPGQVSLKPSKTLEGIAQIEISEPAGTDMFTVCEEAYSDLCSIAGIPVTYAGKLPMDMLIPHINYLLEITTIFCRSCCSYSNKALPHCYTL